MLRFNKFDSGLLADKVGSVDLTNVSTSSLEKTLEAAAEQGHTEGYDMISADVPREVFIPGWNHVGNLIRYEGTLDTAVQKLSRFIGRCNVRKITDDDMKMVTSFLHDWIAENRFSRDSNISRERVLMHKIKILEKYLGEGATGFLCEDAGSLAGLQLSYVGDSDAVIFYEIEIAPPSRQGFLALDLIGSALQCIVEKRPDLKRVCTQIYEDNNGSHNLFHHLGMQQTGGKRCFYHCWPKQNNMKAV